MYGVYETSCSLCGGEFSILVPPLFSSWWVNFGDLVATFKSNLRIFKALAHKAKARIYTFLALSRKLLYLAQSVNL